MGAKPSPPESAPDTGAGFAGFPAERSLADADWTLTGDEGSLSGAALATGEVNGDGAADLLVGAPWTGTSRGAVALARGPIASGRLRDAARVVSGSGRYANTAYAGYAVLLMDFDGDGLDDVIFGEPGGGTSGGDGAVQVRSGLSLGDEASFDATLDGEGDYDALGATLVAADVDGDGAAELLSGAPYYPWGALAGAVYVLPTGLTGEVEAADVAWARLVSTADGDGAGWALAAGDLDGDGADDLAVGAAYASGAWSGGAYVAVGVEAGDRALQDGVWIAGGGAGQALAIGDLDGDGNADLALGAAGQYERVDGAIYLFYGEPKASGDAADADAVIVGGAGEGLGAALRAADLDGDGAAELLASGATGVTEEDSQSAAWVLQAPAAGAADRVAQTRVSLAGAAVGDGAGYALGVADVSGDGALDLLISAPKDEAEGEDAGAVFGVLRG